MCARACVCALRVFFCGVGDKRSLHPTAGCRSRWAAPLVLGLTNAWVFSVGVFWCVVERPPSGAHLEGDMRMGPNTARLLPRLEGGIRAALYAYTRTARQRMVGVELTISAPTIAAAPLYKALEMR